MSTSKDSSFENFQKELLAKMAELRSKDAEALRARNAELRQLEEFCWNKDAEIIRLKSIESELQNRIEKLREENLRRSQESDTVLAEVTELKQQIEAARTQIQVIQYEGNRKLARITDGSWAKQLELESLKTEHAKATADLAALIQYKENSEKQIELLRAETASQKAELRRAMAEVREIEAQSRAEAKIANQSIIQVSRDREDYVRGLERTIASLEAKIHSLQSDRQSAITSVAAQARDTKELETQILNLRSALESTKNEHAVEIQSLIERHNSFSAKMREKSQSAVDRLKLEFENEKAGIQSGNSAKLSSMADRYEMKIDELCRSKDARIEQQVAVEKELAAEIQNYRIKTAANVQQIESLQRSNRALNATLSELKDQNQQLDAAISKLENQLQAALADSQSINLVLQDSIKELERERSSRQKTEVRLDETIQKNSELVGQLASLHEQALDKESVIFSLRAEATANSRETEELKTRLSNTIREVEDLKVEHQKSLESARTIHRNEISEERLSRQSEAIAWANRLNEQMQSYEAEKSKLEKLRQDAQQELIVAKTESSTTISNLKAELETHRRSFFEMNEKLTKTISHFESQNSRISSLNTENTKLRARIADLEENLESSVQKFELETELARQAAADKLNLELVDLEAKLKELSQENSNLRMALSSKAANFKADEKEFQIRCEHRERQISVREKQLALREMQLKQYSVSITDQKAEFVRQTKSLAEEVAAAAKMHPLKDFLKMTEFELSRIEVQLKLTPTISSDRAKLASYFEKMMEQKSFLTKVVEESERKFAEQAEHLLELVRSPKMASTPPPPPLFIRRGEESRQNSSDQTPGESHARHVGSALDPVIDN